MPEFPPLEDSTSLMSESRRKFWASAVHRRSPLKQSHLLVLQSVMGITARPTDPSESIEFGYQNKLKFHDREPELIVEGIEDMVPDFWADYPRQDMKKPMTMQEKKAAVGEAAKAFYRHGLPGYGKPALRVNTPISIM